MQMYTTWLCYIINILYGVEIFFFFFFPENGPKNITASFYGECQLINLQSFHPHLTILLLSHVNIFK